MSTKHFLGPRPVLAGSLLLGLTAFVVVNQGCSFVTNETAIQCVSEAECLDIAKKQPAFAGTTCDPNTKTCVKVELPAECQTNADCGAKPGEAATPSICRKRDHKCIKLLGDDVQCTRVIGKPDALLDDNVIIMGAITPARSGELGDVQELAVELAQSQISPESVGGGIPGPGGKSRPFVVVSCLEFTDQGLQGMLKAANHLVRDIEVPVVLGPVDSSDARLAYTEVFKQTKTLHLVPGGSFVSGLSSLGSPIDVPLMWRLNHNDQQIADTLQPFIDKELVPQLIKDGNYKAGDDLRIAILEEGDFKGTEVGAQIRSKLRWNKNDQGQPASCAENAQKSPSACIRRDFGNLNDKVGNPSPEGKVAVALGGVITQNGRVTDPGGDYVQPHIVIHSYATFGIPRIVFPIEAAWDNGPAIGKARPYHIGLFPPFNTFAPMFGFMDVWSPVEAASPYGYVPFKKRMFAFYPRTGLENDAGKERITNFVLEFQNKFPDFPVSNTPSDSLVRLYYDGVFMAALAIGALNDKPITGENLARTLPRLVQKDSPTTVLLGGATGGATIQSELQKAWAALAQPQQNINVEGISGNLDLDPATASNKYSMEISCPNQTVQGKATNFIASGFYFDQQSGALVGQGTVFDKTKTKCPFLK